jgi:uncharacterized protein YkwD
MTKLTLKFIGSIVVAIGAVIGQQATSLAIPIDLSNSDRETLLTTHNKYRQAVSVAPLKWSPHLAANAQQWANHLATLGGRRLQHATLNNEGENLWAGTSGRFSYSRMVDAWGSEKRLYQGEILTESNYTRFSHYTQIVWRNTTQVGCAAARSGGNDILVCRYSVAGNVLGERPY